MRETKQKKRESVSQLSSLVCVCRDLEALLKTAYVHLQRIGKERDNLFNVCKCPAVLDSLPSCCPCERGYSFFLVYQSVVESTQEKDFYKEQQQQVSSEFGVQCMCILHV